MQFNINIQTTSWLTSVKEEYQMKKASKQSELCFWALYWESETKDVEPSTFLYHQTKSSYLVGNSTFEVSKVILHSSPRKLSCIDSLWRMESLNVCLSSHFVDCRFYSGVEYNCSGFQETVKILVAGLISIHLNASRALLILFQIQTRLKKLYRICC